MILQFDRPLETETLMDLVSYGDPAHEEPAPEARILPEDEGFLRWRALLRHRRSRSPARSWRRGWAGFGRWLIARTRLP